MENKDDYGPYKEVYVRVLKTCRTRFKAYVRFQRHNKASMATITFSSIILLIVPLAQGFNIPLKYDQNVINYVQILLALVILVISSMLYMANFSVRAERFHNCGRELNVLARKLFIKRDIFEVESDYEKYLKEYDIILSNCENHSQTDFMICQLEMIEYFSPTVWFKIRTYAKYMIEFIPYLLILILELGWIYLLFFSIPN